MSLLLIFFTTVHCHLTILRVNSILPNLTLFASYKYLSGLKKIVCDNSRYAQKKKTYSIGEQGAHGEVRMLEMQRKGTAIADNSTVPSVNVLQCF